MTNQKQINPTYTVQRVKKDMVNRITNNIDEFYGPIHASEDGNITLCNREIGRNGTWYILTTNFEDGTTCKRCLLEITARNKAVTDNV